MIVGAEFRAQAPLDEILNSRNVVAGAQNSKWRVCDLPANQDMRLAVRAGRHRAQLSPTHGRLSCEIKSSGKGTVGTAAVDRALRVWIRIKIVDWAGVADASRICIRTFAVALSWAGTCGRWTRRNGVIGHFITCFLAPAGPLMLTQPCRGICTLLRRSGCKPLCRGVACKLP